MEICIDYHLTWEIACYQCWWSPLLAFFFNTTLTPPRQLLIWNTYISAFCSIFTHKCIYYGLNVFHCIDKELYYMYVYICYPLYCMCLRLAHFECCMGYYYVNIPHFIFPFFYCWMFRLFFVCLFAYIHNTIMNIVHVSS